jgi:hypothetical protein
VPIFHLAIEGTGREREILSDAQSQSNELTRKGREEAYLALLANGRAGVEKDIKNSAVNFDFLLAFGFCIGFHSQVTSSVSE